VSNTYQFSIYEIRNTVKAQYCEVLLNFKVTVVTFRYVPEFRSHIIYHILL